MRGTRKLQHLPTGCAWLAVAAIIAVAIATPAGAAEGSGREAPDGATRADRAGDVIAAARSHIGAPYRSGGTGPGFDCSGLVYRVFKETGNIKAIGGKRRTAAGYLRWFQARGLVSRKGGNRGDLVVYNDGSHVGIYIGNGKVVSALLRGVRKHGIHRMNIPFRAFLHTRLAGDPHA